ncbi:MAG: pyridoxine 5'-phosphate synthase [Kiritimatiellae bacterium]|nr:pyridoxine 5'-phosphate synthase [Kiritimatiellia bacterium]
MPGKARLKLGVNIDHVATLRQARGTVYPDVLEAAKACARAGADGLTVHLREDRRHIQDADVYALRKWDGLPLNLEMANAPEIVAIALKVRPPEVCLVPEKRRELTTEGGLDAVRGRKALRPTLKALARAGIRVSLFISADPDQIEAAAELGAPCIELHTGAFCDAAPGRRPRELAKLIKGAKQAARLGLQVNAGHGINLDNVGMILRVPHLDTLNIGHSIVARAVFVGMERAVREMIRATAGYRGGEA